MRPLLTRRPLLVLPALLAAGPARGAALLFPWGVASGDPRPDGVVLWTRLDAAGAGFLDASIDVHDQSTIFRSRGFAHGNCRNVLKQKFLHC